MNADDVPPMPTPSDKLRQSLIDHFSLYVCAACGFDVPSKWPFSCCTEQLADHWGLCVRCGNRYRAVQSMTLPEFIAARKQRLGDEAE